jgi:hypothetical protein
MRKLLKRLDSIRRPAVPDIDKPVKPTETVGEGGTAIYSGYIQPKEKSADLTGQQRWITFSEILSNVAIVGAGVRYFLNLVGKAGWKVQPSDPKNPEAVELAKKVEEILYGMETPWVRVVRRAAMYRLYGYSVQEWTARLREDGIYALKDIEPRPQPTIERWDTDETGKVIGVVQRSAQTQKEIYIPRGKIVYVVDDSLSDSPEGLGLFRHITPHAKRLMRYEQLEGIGYETDLRGIPVLRAPLAFLQKLVDEKKISAAKRDQIIAPLREFIQNHVRGPETGMLLDSVVYRTTDEKGTPSSVQQFMVELLKGDAAGLKEIADAIRRLISSIAQILGVEHLLLGQTGDRGSFALARDKTQNFFLIVDSVLRELAESFEKDVVLRVFELNGWNVDLLPTLKPEPIKFRDLEQLATVLRDLAQAGAPLLPDDPAINEIRDLLGLPRIDEIGLASDAALRATEVEDNLPEPGEEEGEED